MSIFTNTIITLTGSGVMVLTSALTRGFVCNSFVFSALSVTLACSHIILIDLRPLTWAAGLPGGRWTSRCACATSRP